MASIGADGSSTQLAFVEETVWGETPATPVFTNIRSTGNGLAPTLNKAVSDEITATSGITDVIPTQGGAEGDVNFEPSYGEFMDAVFEHALRADFNSFGVLKASNERKSMTLERNIPVDGVPYYFRYEGSRVSTLAVTLDAEATSPITGTIGTMGKEENTDTSIVAGATYLPSNTNPVMSMPELRALYVEIAGVPKTACFKTLSFNTNSNLRSQQGKCTDVSTYPDLLAKGVGYGRREVTLDVAYYFNDLDFAAMFQENTSGLFSYILADGERGYKITYPRGKIMESSIPIEGNDSDVVQNMTIQALIDPTEGTDVIVEKIPSLAAGAAVKLEEVTIDPSPDFRGTFYKDGTQNDAKDVYASVDGINAIWWSTADAAWAVTLYVDIGTFPTVAGWENTNAADPTGTWAIIGTATGDMDGTAYDPAA